MLCCEQEIHNSEQNRFVLKIYALVSLFCLFFDVITMCRLASMSTECRTGFHFTAYGAKM